ncbi:MAG: response regulator [Methylococcaceae bacterium]
MGAIFVVDDDPLIQEILLVSLQKAGYPTRLAKTVKEAWQVLSSQPDLFDAVLLDRLMPDGDGIDVLRRMKKHPALMRTPVIMQTGLTSQVEVLEGLKSGAFYYLSKPFSVATLMAIVDAAVADCRHYRELRQKVKRAAGTLAYLSQAEFRFRTPGEATDIASLLANVYHDPDRLVLGLSELMINAVEHGNLCIDFAQKTELLKTGSLAGEIQTRLTHPGYADRFACIHFERGSDAIRFQICDEGEGFDWEQFLEITPERALHSHGRGIAMAKSLSFDQVEYQGSGNRVLVTVFNPPQ